MLTLVAMLYITSVWPIDFIARSLYLFYSFAHFATPPPTPGNQLICSLYPFFCLFFFSHNFFEIILIHTQVWMRNEDIPSKDIPQLSYKGSK